MLKVIKNIRQITAKNLLAGRIKALKISLELIGNVLLDLMTYGQQEFTNANKVLQKVGRNGFDWTFAEGSSFVLR